MTPFPRRRLRGLARRETPPLAHGGSGAGSGLGPRGESAAPAACLELSDAEAHAAFACGFAVGVVLHTLDSDWSRQQVDGITATLADYGAEVVEVVDSGFDASRQSEEIDRMIQTRPDAIISIPVDETMTAAAHRRIAEAGIALVLMDNVPRGLRPGVDYVSVVSADSDAAGRIAAELLAPHVAQGAEIGVLGFAAEFFVTGEREASFRAWFQGNRPDVGLWGARFRDPADANAVASELLSAHPAVEGLFVVWDDPAMAALAAIRDLGRHVALTTVDLGMRIALEFAAGTHVKGLAAQQPYDQGVAEALAAVGALLGKQLPSWVVVPALPVRRETILEDYERVWHAAPPAELVALLNRA